MGTLRRSCVLLVIAGSLGCGAGPKRDQPTAGAPEASLPVPACEPGRCLEDIGKVIGPHRAAARACYDQARKSHPDIKGRLIINFEIDPDGAIVDVSQGAQDDQITDTEVVACVSDVIKGLTFARSARGKRTRAYHRFEFSPR